MITTNTNRREWLAQLVVALEILVTLVVVSWTEPISITARAIARTGEAGWAVVLMLGVSCVVLVLDVVVNDLLSDRYQFRSALRWRVFGFFGVSILLGILGALVAYAIGYTSLLYVYWLNGAFAGWLAYRDIFDRHAAQ